MTADISKKFIFILIASILLFSVVTASVSASGAFENILGFFAKLFTGKSINEKSITGQTVYERVQARNSISCDEIQDENKKEACLLRDALKNPGSCGYLPAEKADWCYFVHSMKGGNITLCASISDAKTKSRCDNFFDRKSTRGNAP